MEFSKAEKPQGVTLVQPRDRTRPPDQIKLDELVTADLVKPWTDAGKPLPLTDDKTGALVPNPASPDLPLKVPAKQRTEFKAMVRRALTPHKLVPVWYTDSKEDSDGNVVVTFQAAPRPEKPATAAQDGEKAPEASQEQASQGQPHGTGDQGQDQPQASPSLMDRARGRR